MLFLHLAQGSIALPCISPMFVRLTQTVKGRKKDKFLHKTGEEPNSIALQEIQRWYVLDKPNSLKYQKDVLKFS